MPTLPRRRKPGTLAKNNTVNEILDYLAGDTLPGISANETEYVIKAEYVICQVRSRYGESDDSRYYCTPLYLVRPGQKQGLIKMKRDGSATDDKKIVVHYLGSVSKDAAIVDVSDDDTVAQQRTLTHGDIIEVRQIVRPNVDSEKGHETIWISFTGGSGSIPPPNETGTVIICLDGDTQLWDWDFLFWV